MPTPKTPLVRMEENLIEWRRLKRAQPSAEELRRFTDGVMADARLLADSWRMVTTITGTASGVHSDSCTRLFEEFQARREFRRPG